MTDGEVRYVREGEVAIVIFDSGVAPADAAGLYLTARAAEVASDAVPDAIAAFSRESVAQGLAAWDAGDVTGSARHRLYRAAIAERWTLGPGDRRIPLSQ